MTELDLGVPTSTSASGVTVHHGGLESAPETWFGHVVPHTQANLVRALDGQPVHDVVNSQDPLVRKRS